MREGKRERKEGEREREKEDKVMLLVFLKPKCSLKALITCFDN